MKKASSLMLTLVLSTFIVACNEEEKSTVEVNGSVDTEQEQTFNESEQAMETGNIASMIEVTIPADLIAQEELIAEETEAEQDSDVTENEDGSITYTMSEKIKEEIVADLATEISEEMQEIKKDDDYSSIEDVTANDSFTEFTFTANQKEFEKSFDEFASYKLGTSGAYYQLFNDMEVENYKVKIFVEDTDTGETFDTIEFPATLGQPENTDE